tara:strand:+ start:899 stop:1168 length:270 start_codon:yes stop_codon:yes gene_type:complete
MSATKMKKEELTKKYAKNPKDKGSTNVQVAILSEKIKNLTEHLKENKKDQSTRRGLLKMVGKRKKLLFYLKNKSNETYKSLIKNLGLRH